MFVGANNLAFVFFVKSNEDKTRKKEKKNTTPNDVCCPQKTKLQGTLFHVLVKLFAALLLSTFEVE